MHLTQLTIDSGTITGIELLDKLDKLRVLYINGVAKDIIETRRHFPRIMVNQYNDYEMEGEEGAYSDSDWPDT
jgi:pyruvate formate-lyase activating enzyme-like uncharacterized protein